MRNAYKLLAAVAAAAAMMAGTGAGAQGYGQCGNGRGNGGAGMACAGPGHGPGAMGGGWGGGHGAGWQAGPAANAEARLAYLKDELKLLPSQAAVWTAYETAVKTQAASMQTRRDSMVNAQSAADRMALMAAFATQRAQDFGVLNAAVQALHAALTPEQKAIFDAGSRGRMSAMGGRGMQHFR